VVRARKKRRGACSSARIARGESARLDRSRSRQQSDIGGKTKRQRPIGGGETKERTNDRDCARGFRSVNRNLPNSRGEVDLPASTFFLPFAVSPFHLALALSLPPSFPFLLSARTVRSTIALQKTHAKGSRLQRKPGKCRSPLGRGRRMRTPREAFNQRSTAKSLSFSFSPFSRHLVHFSITRPRT